MTSTILLSSERTSTGLMIIYILAFLVFVPIKITHKIIFAFMVSLSISIFFYFNDAQRKD